MIKFHDPEKYLKQATKIQYFWFIDDVAYGQTNQVECAVLFIPYRSFYLSSIANIENEPLPLLIDYFGLRRYTIRLIVTATRIKKRVK